MNKYFKHFKKANDFYEQKNYIDAIKFYEKAILENDVSPSPLYNTAICYMKLKDYTNAIPFLKSAINLDYNSNYFFNLGYCYIMLKEYKKAYIYFNTAWALNNDNVDCEKAINIILKKYI